MPVSNPTLSYPKARGTFVKIIPFTRTDNQTVRAWLPKDAIIVGVHIWQSSNAATGTGSVSLGTPGSPNAFINGATMATSGSPRLNNPDSAAAAGLFTKLAADAALITTYTVGSSTAGGEGLFVVEYFVPGPGEQVDD